MPVAGLPRNLFRNLRARINQYESTTGRRVGQQTIQALLESELSVAAERASQDARLELQKSTTEREFGLREKSMEQEANQFAQNLQVRKDEGAFNREAERTRLGLEADRIKAEKKAAMMSGGLQLASTGVQGGILYKMLTKDAAKEGAKGSSSWLRDAISALRGEEQAGAASPSAPGISAAPEAAGGLDLAQSAALSLPSYVPGALETSVSTLSAGTAGPAYSLGTQATATSPYSLTGVTYSPPAMEAAAFETGAEATGAGGGVSGALGTAAAYAAPAAAGYGVGSVVGPAFAESESLTDVTPWGGEKTESTISGAGAGAAAGAAIGSVVPVVGTGVGAVIGAITGAIGGGGGGSIICTELQRQGYLPERIVELDGLHRERYIDDDTYFGYIKWAKYVVKAMQKSHIVTLIVAPIGRAWAYEMASRLDPEIPGSRLGQILMKIGVPICRVIGGIGK